jgi:uncharacterized membrane protein
MTAQSTPTVARPGPAGSGAGPWYRRPASLRLLLVLTFLTCLLGYAEKASCRDTRNWTDDFQYTRLCYSDVVALYGAERLDEGARPFVDYPVEYPVLIGAAMQASAEVSYLAPATAAGEQDLAVAVFFDATAVLLVLAAGVVVVCTARTAGARPQIALLVALAPSLLVHAFTNWDLLAVAFASGALLAWSRRAPRLTGLLLGLGAATKLYPILFLVPLGLLCLRAGRLRTWARTAGYAVGALVLVNLPVYLVAGYFTEDKLAGPGVRDVLRDGGGLGAALAPHHATGAGGSGETATNALLRFLDLNSERVADWDSVPFALQYLASAFSPKAFAPVHLVALAVAVGLVGFALVRTRRGRAGAEGFGTRERVVLTVGALAVLLVGVGLPRLLSYTAEVQTLPVGGLNLVTAALFLAALVAVGVLILVAPRRPRVPQVVFLTVVAFLLTNKVFSPQYVLWVVPLLVLARPRWRSFLLWQATEVAVLVTRYYYFAGSDDEGTGWGLGWFVGAVALRDVALVALAVLVVRDVLHPERDEVRGDDPAGDDPAGGVLTGTGDQWTLRRSGTASATRSVPAATPPADPSTEGPLPESPADVRA